MTLFAYQPAWHGAPLWDDDGHLTRPELQSVQGLVRIWTDVRATQQYYPLVHSTFWVMHRLWGDHTTGYHLANIALHALSALLFAILLSRLKIPGAWFAAFIFALHPVHAESVAWMTELKNTLSTPLYLGAALAYLRFDERRRPGDWALSLLLFVLALLSKTVTSTLPISLAILMWWRRGALEWRRDLRPLVPFVALAVAGGALTAWVEHSLIGAQGTDFALTPIQRVLIAGRAVWFYLYSLVWPAHLVFSYPRWDISPTTWWQYLFPLGLAALFLVLWLRRDRSRTPVAVLAIYVVTLAPALGFVDVYPFRYSFVADHFQYAASLAPIAAFAAAAAMGTAAAVSTPAVATALALIVLLPLATLTWMNSRQYVNDETLYRSTIAKNPNAWMAYHNLAVLRLHGPDQNLPEALANVEASLRINPAYPEGLNSRGYIRQQLGDSVAARADYERAIQLNPTFAAPYNNLGTLLYKQGRLDDALSVYREAVRLNPKDPEAQRNLGIVLLDLGRTTEASPYIRRAFELNPQNPDVISNMASLALHEGRLDEAIELFRRAIALRPDSPGARNNLGFALERQGHLEEAEAQYREVVRLDPNSPIAHDNLGYLLLQRRQFGEAAAELETVVRLRPDTGASYASLGGAYLGLGRIDDAIAAYRRALSLSASVNLADVHNSLGVALAQRGQLREAITHFEEALRLDPSHVDARRNLARARGK